MAMIGTDLYAGGLFETANGLAANNIAKWNGSAWSALGSGMNSSVVALAVSGTDLYAGGEFTTAGGVSASRIAKWNGSAWSALGSGVNNSVLALAVSGTDLFASGLFATAGGKVSGYVALARLAAVAPDIAVEQPLSTNLTDGTASVAFGSLALGTSGTAKTFTLRNTGTADLTGLVVNKDGPNSADFSVNSSGMTTTVIPAGSTAFTVTFTPGGTISAVRMAALHIASNDPDENPFDIALTGLGLSTTTDMDGDGLSDWAEGQYASMGFDWQLGQPALVSTLNSGANAANLYTQTQYNTNFITGRTTGQNDVINAPNPYGLYTPTQVQALNVGTPLIQRNATTGEFTLTIGVEKSTNLNTFTPFLMTAPQTLINAEGKLEFRFTVPDNAAFFQLRVR